MASQSEIIYEINSSTESMAHALSSRPKRSCLAFVFRLLFFPVVVSVWAYLARGAVFGGLGALKDSVNIWASRFITEAKIYELAYADKGKAIIESRYSG